MLYLKSALAVIAAMIVAELMVIAGGICLLLVIAYRRPAAGGEGGLGWDPVSFARTAPGLIILLVALAFGFWWEYRRLAAH